MVAVIVTHDRPALLRQCLRSVLGQGRAPDDVVVVDNASGPETQAVLAAFPTVQVTRLERNLGGAGGYHAGLRAALAIGADWLWVMDDDGRPQQADCLATLLQGAASAAADLVGPLVLDVDRPEQLAFPIRITGRTRFTAAELRAHGPVRGFVHLFNGALISRALIEQIGLPDRRLFIRGDEVEFLFRARRAGATVRLETGAAFLHPGSAAEIHPIFGGLFYACMPESPIKQYYQFRNRGHVFRNYGMWPWLAADVVRYGYYFLVSRRGDLPGFAGWVGATWEGTFGELNPPPGSHGPRQPGYRLNG